MKDGLNRRGIERLAQNLLRGLPHIDSQRFVTFACAGLDELELKARVERVADAMAEHLPSDARESIEGILRAIPAWDQGPTDDPLRGFATWPVFVYVEKQGIELGEFALQALGALTHLFSAEFSVRPFIEKNTEMSMAVIADWTQHSSDHVRRLASEGIRPRLPWAAKLASFVQDPKPVIAILDALVDDESLYVRRSVANNLSDIAADHPELAIATCKRWLESPSAGRRWVAKRATRNLIKAGHPEIWDLHGYTAAPNLVIEALQVAPQQVALDQSFSIDFDLVSKSSNEQRLVIDYVVHHVRAGGKATPKIFKLREQRLAPGESVSVSKQHAFRTITTRRYYPGPHRIEIQVNGQRYSEAWIELR